MLLSKHARRLAMERRDAQGHDSVMELTGSFSPCSRASWVNDRLGVSVIEIVFARGGEASSSATIHDDWSWRGKTRHRTPEAMRKDAFLSHVRVSHCLLVSCQSYFACMRGTPQVTLVINGRKSWHATVHGTTATRVFGVAPQPCTRIDTVFPAHRYMKRVLRY